jgi:MSHA biogenesis protein MshK
MDERLIAVQKGMLGLVAGLTMAHSALGQALSDPTRPPDAGGYAVDGSMVGSTSPTRLQSVLISPGRTIAVINGVAVPLGGKFGNAKLVRVTEHEAVLREGRETEVLRLLPGIEKIPVKRAGAGGKRR